MEIGAENFEYRCLSAVGTSFRKGGVFFGQGDKIIVFDGLSFLRKLKKENGSIFVAQKKREGC